MNEVVVCFCSNVVDAVILHYYDDDLDLFHHCNLLISFCYLSGILLNFEEPLFQRTPLNVSEYKICNMKNDTKEV